MEEEEALEAEEKKLKLRKEALAADKAVRKAVARANRLRGELGQSLTKQVEDEGVEQTSKSVAGKLVGLAGKLALKGFVKTLFFLGGAIKGGGKALKELGPAIKTEIASERKKLGEAQKAGMSDVIDADFKVLDKNLKAVDDDKWLLGPPESKTSTEAPAAEKKSLPPKSKKKAAPAAVDFGNDLPMAAEEDVVEAAVRRLHAALMKVEATWPRHGMPSIDSLDRMPDEPESIENDIKTLRGLARVKGNDLAGVNLRLLANALEKGGVEKAAKLLKSIERSMDEDDFDTFLYLLPDSLLRSFDGQAR